MSALSSLLPSTSRLHETVWPVARTTPSAESVRSTMTLAAPPASAELESARSFRAQVVGSHDATARVSDRLPALGLALPHASSAVTLLRDPRQIRQFYRLARLRGLHAAFADGEWRDTAEPKAEELLTAAREGSDVARLVSFQHKEPFKRYLFLLEAEQLSERVAKNEPLVRERLQQTQTALWDEYAEDIASGFNTAPSLMSIVHTLDGWDEARTIYRDWVTGSPGLGALHRNLAQAFGLARLRTGLASMRKALRADLASPLVQADAKRRVTQTVDLERTVLLERLIASVDDFMRRGRRGH